MEYIYETKPDKCPVCGSKEIREILYGTPIFTPELDEKIDKGDVILGECFYNRKNPTWRSKDCRTPFHKAYKTWP